MTEQAEPINPGAWPDEERRKDVITRAIRDIQAEMKVGTKRMDEQDGAIAENTRVTKEIKEDTAEIVEAFKSLQGALKVFNMLGTLARPLGYIVMAVSAVAGLVTAVKSGNWSK